ncbi:MAG: hypothetical protein HYX61_11035 [Gammaproteobacteria bacterium]|jgi:hypothetical protein|nr:hypothetical protein [Gammaproteobacteria bacterium]
MWQVDTTKHYKIWFSKKPSEFLDVENQERFIQACHDNPHITFSFIYSADCLDAAAIVQLKSFCDKYHIKPIDFDKEIPPLLQDEQDKKLYGLAKKEIAFTCKNEGGNMAAASDYSRAMRAIIEKFGIYSDCDVGIKFSSVPKILPVKEPVVFPVEIVKEARVSIPALNNEFLAFAFDPNEPEKIDPIALKRLRLLQAELMKRATIEESTFFKLPLEGISTDLIPTSQEAFVLKQFFIENPAADIFTLRRYLEKFDVKEFIRMKSLEFPSEILSEYLQEVESEEDYKQAYIKFLKKDAIGYILWREYADPSLSLSAEEIIDVKTATLKHKLYVMSVAGISGPVNYHALFQDKVPKQGFTVLGNQFFASISPAEKWQEIVNAFEDSSIQANNLSKNVLSQNKESIRRKRHRAENQPLMLEELLSDQSWTPLGALRKEQRIQNKANATLCSSEDLQRNATKSRF